MSIYRRGRRIKRSETTADIGEPELEEGEYSLVLTLKEFRTASTAKASRPLFVKGEEWYFREDAVVCILRKRNRVGLKKIR